MRYIAVAIFLMTVSSSCKRQSSAASQAKASASQAAAVRMQSQMLSKGSSSIFLIGVAHLGPTIFYQKVQQQVTDFISTHAPTVIYFEWPNMSNFPVVNWTATPSPIPTIAEVQALGFSSGDIASATASKPSHQFYEAYLLAVQQKLKVAAAVNFVSTQRNGDAVPAAYDIDYVKRFNQCADSPEDLKQIAAETAAMGQPWESQLSPNSTFINGLISAHHPPSATVTDVDWVVPATLPTDPQVLLEALFLHQNSDMPKERPDLTLAAGIGGYINVAGFRLDLVSAAIQSAPEGRSFILLYGNEHLPYFAERFTSQGYTAGPITNTDLVTCAALMAAGITELNQMATAAGCS